MTTDAITANAVLDLALRAAEIAGSQLLARFDRPAEGLTEKSSATDLVSDADREADETILGMIRAARPQTPVVLCKVMPSSASKKRPVEKIQKLNSLLDGIIKADPLITPCDTFAPFANEHGEAKKEEFPDLLHPNAAGYAKWTEALQPILKKLNLGQ